MVVRVLGDLLTRSHNLAISTGTLAFVAWRHTLSAKMAESHSTDTQSQTLVLIAVDASPQAEAAVDWYLKHAHLERNKLLLLHVAEPPIVAAQQGVYITAEVWDGMMEKAKEEARVVENDYAQKIRAAQISATIRAMFHSRPGEAIIEVAKEEKVSYIVMGTRGLGSIRRTIMGSVSSYVVHHSHCPVVVCRYG